MGKKGCGGCQGTFYKDNYGTPRRNNDGSVTFTKTSIEPPPDLDGYLRSPNDDWTFIPQWDNCGWRVQQMLTKPCGAVVIFTVCDNPQNSMYRAEIDFQICQTCPLSRERFY